MKELYVSYTPYHILLNSSIASSRDESIEKDLIIIEDFSNIDKIVKGLNNWKDNPFREHIVIDGKFSTDLPDDKSIFNIFRKNSVFNVFKKGITEIKKRYENQNFQTVFTGNDERPHSQFLEYICRKNNGINVYVEDGSELYNDNVSSSFPTLEFIYYRLSLGSWYDDVRVLGKYRFTDEIRAFRPDLVRDDLKDKRIEQIDLENFIDLQRTGLTDTILNEFEFDLYLNKNDIIIFLPHSSLVRERDLLPLYKDIISRLKEYNKDILLKYHPREKDHYLSGYDEDILNLPQSLPSEIFFLQMINNSPVIIGDVSTCLFTSKIINDQSCVISLINLLDIESKYLKEVFSKIGVIIPNTRPELEEILSRHLN